MSRPLLALYYYLWIAPHLLLIVIAAAMFRRGLHRKFLMFFLYTIFELCQFIFLLYLASSQSLRGPAYYRAFIFGSALSITLRFGIIYEIFTDLSSRYQTIKHVGARVFRWVAAVLLLVAVGLASGTFTPHAYSPQATLSVIDQTVSIMQCGLLISLFVFSKFYGLVLRSVAFGIALGFGILECATLGSSPFRTHLGSNNFWDFFVMGVYHVCVLIWLFYVLTPEKPGSPPSAPKLPDHNLDVWNEELDKLIRQ